jgi:hypothetical protein
MPIYPTANSTDMQDLLTITQFTNSVSEGVLFLVLITTIWGIAFVGSLANGREAYRGFIFASFICTILSIILALIGLLSLTYIYLFIILLGFGLVWASLAKSKG